MTLYATWVREPEGQQPKHSPTSPDVLDYAVRAIGDDLAPEGSDDLVAAGQDLDGEPRYRLLVHVMQEATWSYVLWDEDYTPLGLVGAQALDDGTAHTFMVYRADLLRNRGLTTLVRGLLDAAQVARPELVITTRSLLGRTVTPMWMQALGFVPTGEISPSALEGRQYVHFVRRRPGPHLVNVEESADVLRG